jgi:adenylate cyclase
VPRSTAFRYKGVEIDPQRAARELNVRVLLTGRMLLRGDTLNVQAELVDAAVNSQLWGQKYNRTLSDMWAVEEQIAREIADTLRLKLNRAENRRLTLRATQDGEAYQLYLRGRHLWNRRTRDALGRAIVYFQQAIDRDPSYALAYAGLADCYAVLGTFTFGPPGETFPRAKARLRTRTGTTLRDDQCAARRGTLPRSPLRRGGAGPAKYNRLRAGLLARPPVPGNGLRGAA